MGDPIIYESIKNGNIKAFEALFQELYPSMCAVATRFITDRDAAEDIAQEAFIKLWEKRTAYKEIENISLRVREKSMFQLYTRQKSYHRLHISRGPKPGSHIQRLPH